MLYQGIMKSVDVSYFLLDSDISRIMLSQYKTIAMNIIADANLT